MVPQTRRRHRRHPGYLAKDLDLKLIMRNLLNSMESTRRTLRLAAQYRAARQGIILLQDREVGLFSIYQQVLGALAVCKRLKSSLKIESVKGSYYSPERAEAGWWTYYFENDLYFEEHNHNGNIVQIEPSKGAAKLTHLGNALTRRQAFKLTQLLKLRSDVQQMIDDYANDYFSKNHTIGIHYRGTDKVNGIAPEAKPVSYQRIYELVKKQKPDSKVFVATDEQSFIDFMKDRLGDRLLSIEAQRSADGLPIHHQSERSGPGFDRYKIGLEAVLDCFLLARTDFLIRTDSNLSKVSTYLNPEMQVIEV